MSCWPRELDKGRTVLARHTGRTLVLEWRDGRLETLAHVCPAPTAGHPVETHLRSVLSELGYAPEAREPFSCNIMLPRVGVHLGGMDRVAAVAIPAVTGRLCTIPWTEAPMVQFAFDHPVTCRPTRVEMTVFDAVRADTVEMVPDSFGSSVDLDFNWDPADRDRWLRWVGLEPA